MLSLLAAVVLSQGAAIERDSFGVPHILAPNLDDAFFYAGKAVAEDRLWQMDLSRRGARGTMSEIMGGSTAKADADTMATGYTAEELQAQFNAMSPNAKRMMTAYASGVNAAIDDAKRNLTLPKEYAQYGVVPEPWSPTDSIAIAIRLYQIFGQGGAGEVRNLALLMYLQARPNKAQALDIFDDFLWDNDPRSPVTVNVADDPLAKSPPTFPKSSRAILSAQLAAMPKVTLGELLPAVRLASREEVTRVAMEHNTLYKTGSYAIVVGPQRSATGHPMLLSAPQMGHTTPSVVHEMSISCPEYKASGMDVPGVPGIAIGHTPDLAWGLTSGVMDTTDIVYSPLDGDERYKYGSESRPIVSIKRELKVKGEAPRTIDVKRTHYGPVIATSKTGNIVFSQRSIWWMREMRSYESMVAMGSAKTVADVERAFRSSTVSFNAFFALKTGEIGYRYVGISPIRAASVDPRLPAPGDPAHDWKGEIPFAKMPHLLNPKSGLITNWNNKPVAWWPNSDTPAWGRQFRVEALVGATSPARMNLSDLEMGAWKIARTESTWPQMSKFVLPAMADFNPTVSPLAEAARYLQGWDGMNVEGSPAARIYVAFLDALREELFLQTTGNFLSPATFRTVTQPSVILEALDGKTKVKYLGAQTPTAIIRKALEKAVTRLTSSLGPNPALWRYESGKINVPGETPIPYIDRGTYIQIVELAKAGAFGRSVNSPGVAEAGPHSRDQAPLARAWIYKAKGGRWE